MGLGTRPSVSYWSGFSLASTRARTPDFPGELLPDWDIPLPQGAAIVGFIVPVEFQAEIALDLPGELEEFVALVERTLTASGWRSTLGIYGWAPMRRGFVTAEEAALVASLARSASAT